MNIFILAMSKTTRLFLIPVLLSFMPKWAWPHSLHPPSLCVMGEGRGGGGLSHFSEVLCRRDGRDLSQIGILGRNWHFTWRWFFFRWDLKTPCIKNNEYESQTSKQKWFWLDCFSILFFYLNNFVIVRICIFIFDGVYYLFCWD